MDYLAAPRGGGSTHQNYPAELPTSHCARRRSAPSSRLKVGAVHGRHHEKWSINAISVTIQAKLESLSEHQALLSDEAP